MEHRGSRQNIHASLPPRGTAQTRRGLTVWRGGSHGRAEIFALPIFLRLFAAIQADDTNIRLRLAN
jgi:hypothetical protein